MASILKVDTIQDQDGNNIINENANVITVGASGDTVNIVGTLQNNGAAIPGDISSVVAGTGLSGGGTSGDVTLNIEAAQPTITSTGTLTNFTSTGIDDNATSTAITINSSEQVAFTDGTASLPSITNLGDENTGIFFPAADTIAFSEGGVEAMRIDSNGQLNTGKVVVRKDGASEIGQLVILNQSPDSNADLHFKGYAYRDRARIRAVDNASSTTGGSMKIETAGGTSTDGSSLETRMLLDKNGNISFYEDTGTTPKMFWDATNERLGIGTASPTQALDVVGSIEVSDGIYIGGTGTANKLDDYEEGTWTPTYVASTTDFTSVTYQQQNGKYTKIGDTVSLTVTLSTNAITKGSASGEVYIAGLPFTPNSNYSNGTILYNTANWLGDIPDGWTTFGTTRGYLFYKSSTTAVSSINPADMGTGGSANNFIATMIYKTDA